VTDNDGNKSRLGVLRWRFPGENMDLEEVLLTCLLTLAVEWMLLGLVLFVHWLAQPPPKPR
jgi:hypothetical protein